MKSNDKNFLEAALESSEVFADILIDNDALASFPVIGVAFKVAKGIDDIRSRILIHKIARFINNPALQTTKAREELKLKALSQSSEVESIGECLFLVLENMTALSKADLLAKCFAAYLDNVISSSELRRLAYAINLAFEDDLHLFFNHAVLPRLIWLQRLVPCGLARFKLPAVVGEVEFEESSLGHTFRKAYSHAKFLVENEAEQKRRAIK